MRAQNIPKYKSCKIDVAHVAVSLSLSWQQQTSQLWNIPLRAILHKTGLESQITRVSRNTTPHTPRTPHA